jgi:anti-anti-sigma factor
LTGQIGVERRGDTAIVSAHGELDAYVAPDLEEAFAQTARAPFIVVDLTRVSFMDSTALGIVTRAIRDHDEQRGAATRVVLPRSSARRIFEITTLDQMLPVSQSLEDAVHELAGLGDAAS